MLAARSLRHASALGKWVQHECAPPDLAHAVESIWEVDGFVAHPRARIFPNGRIDLVVNIGPPQRVIQGRGIETFDTARVSVSGLQQRPLMVESTRRTHVFGIRFKPAGAFVCLAGAAGAVGGLVVDIRDVLSAGSRSTLDDIPVAGSFEARARLACGWVEERLSAGPSPASHVSWILSRIDADPGPIRVADLRRDARISPKKLAADFRNQVGTTPKTLIRIARFRRALEAMQVGGRGLTEVALESGYYDHSHMTLDFRSFAGLSPQEFLASRYPDGTSAVAG